VTPGGRLLGLFAAAGPTKALALTPVLAAMVRVHFRPVPAQPAAHALWLALAEGEAPVMVGTLRRLEASGQWLAEPRAADRGVARKKSNLAFPTRAAAAEFLLLGLGGFARPTSADTLPQ
jgi:hypothetical protein